MNKNYKSGNNRKTIDPMKTSLKFRRPSTLSINKKPKFAKKLILKINSKPNPLKILHKPITTENAMKKIQSCNTLAFIVDPLVQKNFIKIAIEKLYRVRVKKVNTLITTNGKKKAFVKLFPNFDALDVANRIGFI